MRVTLHALVDRKVHMLHLLLNMSLISCPALEYGGFMDTALFTNHITKGCCQMMIVTTWTFIGTVCCPNSMAVRQNQKRNRTIKSIVIQKLKAVGHSSAGISILSTEVGTLNGIRTLIPSTWWSSKMCIALHGFLSQREIWMRLIFWRNWIQW